MEDLLAGATIVRDAAARSPSFFCTRDVVQVNRRMIRGLVEESLRQGWRRSRISLHPSPASSFHEMVVFERGGLYGRPHKHLQKGESCTILEGAAAFFVFDDHGRVTEAATVSPEETVICRVGANQWHAVIPVSDYAVYLESKPGPFLGVNDSLYPDWAPDGSDPVRTQRYLEELLGQVGARAGRG